MELKPSTIVIVLALWGFLVSSATGTIIGARHVEDQDPPSYNQTRAELALCMASSQRAIEVLDSVSAWIHRSRGGR